MNKLDLIKNALLLASYTQNNPEYEKLLREMDDYVLLKKEPSLKVLDRLFAEHDLDEDRASYIYRDVINAQENK